MHLRCVRLYPEHYPTDQRYPFNQPIFQQTTRLIFSKPITFFVGENGTGKSTLLQAMCRKCDIHIWQGLDRPREQVNPYEAMLYRYLTVEWANGKVPGSFFASDLFQHFAQLLDEWATDDPGQALAALGGPGVQYEICQQ